MHRKYQSPLGRLQPEKIDPEKLKQQGWKENGILVVNINDDRPNWPEKEKIKQNGNSRIWLVRNRSRGAPITSISISGKMEIMIMILMVIMIIMI